MSEYVRTGPVKMETGLPNLPFSQQQIKDIDYEILGVVKPDRNQIERALENQGMDSFEQLIFGDIQAWRTGGRAREEFAYFITDPAERIRLAAALRVDVSDLPEPQNADAAQVSQPQPVPAQAVIEPRRSLISRHRQDPEMPGSRTAVKQMAVKQARRQSSRIQAEVPSIASDVALIETTQIPLTASDIAPIETTQVSRTTVPQTASKIVSSTASKTAAKMTRSALQPPSHQPRTAQKFAH